MGRLKRKLLEAALVLLERANCRPVCQLIFSRPFINLYTCIRSPLIRRSVKVFTPPDLQPLFITQLSCYPQDFVIFLKNKTNFEYI